MFDVRFYEKESKREGEDMCMYSMILPHMHPFCVRKRYSAAMKAEVPSYEWYRTVPYV